MTREEAMAKAQEILDSNWTLRNDVVDMLPRLLQYIGELEAKLERAYQRIGRMEHETQHSGYTFTKEAR